MNNNNKSSGISVGFSGLLTITFIILKLTHIIEWSWIWVLAPLWIELLLLVALLLLLVLLCL